MVPEEQQSHRYWEILQPEGQSIFAVSGPAPKWRTRKGGRGRHWHRLTEASSSFNKIVERRKFRNRPDFARHPISTRCARAQEAADEARACDEGAAHSFGRIIAPFWHDRPLSGLSGLLMAVYERWPHCTGGLPPPARAGHRTAISSRNLSDVGLLRSGVAPFESRKSCYRERRGSRDRDFLARGRLRRCGARAPRAIPYGKIAQPRHVFERHGKPADAPENRHNHATSRCKSRGRSRRAAPRRRSCP